MKKNLQEAEYKEIKGLDIRGQLLQNSGTPEDRGDGKPFLMHKLKVMIGPYQKDIPITNQELRKIMFIQENKKMTLKERIKKELINMVQEGGAEMMAQYQTDAQAGKQQASPKVLDDLYKEFVDKDLKSALIELGIEESKITALYQALTDAMGLQQGGTPVSIKEMIKEELKSIFKEGMAGSAPELDRVPSDKALAIGAKHAEMEKQAKELLRALDDPDEPVSKDLLKQLLNQVLKGLADGADISPSLQGMGESEGKGHLGAPVGGRHRAKQMYRRGYEDGLRGQMPRNLDALKDKHYKAGQKDGEEERDAGRGYD